MTVGKKARRRLQLFQIAEEQGWRCYWCGWPIDELTATREHLRHRSKGGSNARANTVAACFSCNKKRGSNDFPPSGYLLARRRHLPRSLDGVRASSKRVRVGVFLWPGGELA